MGVIAIGDGTSIRYVVKIASCTSVFLPLVKVTKVKWTILKS